MTSIEPTTLTYFFIILKCSFVGPIEIQIIHNIFSCRQIHYIYSEFVHNCNGMQTSFNFIDILQCYHSSMSKTEFSLRLGEITKRSLVCMILLCFVFIFFVTAMFIQVFRSHIICVIFALEMNVCS